MVKKQKNKNKSGFTMLEMMFAVLIMTLLTALICLGMNLSNSEFNDTIRNSEARTLASSINNIITDELSYATDIRMYKFLKSSFSAADYVNDYQAADFDTYLGLSDGTEVVVYSSITQGELTFFACAESNASISAIINKGRLYFYSGAKSSEGGQSEDQFVYDQFRINAMVPSTAYSQGCYLKDLKVIPIIKTDSGYEAVCASSNNPDNWGNILDIDFFDVSYKVCYMKHGTEYQILDEHFQVDNFQ